MPEASAPRKKSAIRVGILFSDDKNLKRPALRYLLLKLNQLQDVFEYELLPAELSTSELAELNFRRKMSNRAAIRDDKIPIYLPDLVKDLRERNVKNHLKESPPHNFVLVTMAKFHDGYYSTRKFKVEDEYKMSVIALGNWRGAMAPPSLAEFIFTLIVRESIAFVSDSLSGSVHLGTKGCLCDFTEDLEEARYKVLHGYICQFCRDALIRDGHPDIATKLSTVLSKVWLGKRSDALSAAGILANLRSDLFVTKGFKPGFWQRLVDAFKSEGTKQALDILAKVALGLILLYLGLNGNRNPKDSNTHKDQSGHFARLAN